MEEKIDVGYDTNSSVNLDFHIDNRLYKIEILRDEKGGIQHVKIVKVGENGDTITLRNDEFTILRYLRKEGELRGAI